MYQANTLRTVQIMIVALLIALSTHVALGVNCSDAPSIPQWVLDRQQYETTYVYMPNQVSEAFAPLWSADRYQYDPTYIARESVVAQKQDIAVPQWVLDRQQYEPNYIYTPATPEPPAQCSIS